MGLLSSSAGLNYCITGVMKLRKIKWLGACDTHEKRNLDRHMLEKKSLNERINLEDLGVDRTIVLQNR